MLLLLPVLLAATAGAPAIAIKQPIAGLIDMQTISWHNTDEGEPTFVMDHVLHAPGLFGGIVVNVTWRALQKTQGAPTDFTSIDDALAQVKAYNAAHADAPLGVKLRVYGGASAPDWVKRLAGEPFKIVRNQQGCPRPPCPLTVGPFWSPPYIAAWRALQAELAARYDPDPVVRAVAVTSCTSQTDEPFVPTLNPQSRRLLERKGLSDKAQQACLAGAVQDYAAWKQTLVDYPINIYSKLDEGGGADMGFSMKVLRGCRTTLGPRCVLDNHALDGDAVATKNDTIERAIARQHGPINFQTESPKAMNCRWTATIARGVDLGAQAIEVWPDTIYFGTDSLTVAEIKRLAALFRKPTQEETTRPGDEGCPGFH